MGTFLTEVNGFTPIIDALAQETSLITAAVYGVAWRFCQMDDGICHASLETIGKRVGVSRKTAERHIKELCALGYLEDTTPDVKHGPHVYKDTGRAKIIGLVEARTKFTGRTESPTCEDDRSDREPDRSDTKSDLGQTESPTKREHEESSKEKEKHALPAQKNFEALAEVCAWDLGTITAKQRGALNQTEAVLRRNGGCAEDIKAFGEFWHLEDWRGKKGDWPRPDQIRSEWGRFKKWYAAGGNIQHRDGKTVLKVGQ